MIDQYNRHKILVTPILWYFIISTHMLLSIGIVILVGKFIPEYNYLLEYLINLLKINAFLYLLPIIIWSADLISSIRNKYRRKNK